MRHKKAVDVKRTGATLVAGFHNANPPLIWRFDLERNHSFAIALQGEEGDWELGVTGPKGDFYSVAHFPAREDAEEAFDCVQTTLMRKNGASLKSSALFVVILAIAVAAVYGRPYLALAKNRVEALLPHKTGTAITSGAQDNTMQNGIPLPADQVLKPPY